MNLLFNKPRWMFESIFTSDYVKMAETKPEEAFMNEAPQMFVISKNANKHCLMTKGDAHIKYFEDTRGWKFEEITNLEAYAIINLK